MSNKLSNMHIAFLLVTVLLSSIIGLSYASERMYHFEVSVLHEIYRWCAISSLFTMILAFSVDCETKFAKKLINFSCVILFWGILATAYHILIQRGILPDSDICKMKITIPDNIDVAKFYKLMKMKTAMTCTGFELAIYRHSISELFCAVFVFLFVYVSVYFQGKGPKKNNQE